jgi:hypothetical protein
VFPSSQNSRQDWELILVTKDRWREGFGNCFHEIFGNCREMTGKLWCLVHIGGGCWGPWVEGGEGGIKVKLLILVLTFDTVPEKELLLISIGIDR